MGSRTALASLFLTLLCGLSFSGHLPPAVPVVYLVASVVAFLLYGLDKAAARGGRRRTSERALHVLGIIGGWPGALIAQAVFRHKSQKPQFQAIFRTTVLLNCGALAWWSWLAR